MYTNTRSPVTEIADYSPVFSKCGYRRRFISAIHGLYDLLFVGNMGIVRFRTGVGGEPYQVS